MIKVEPAIEDVDLTFIPLFWRFSSYAKLTPAVLWLRT